MSENLNQPKEYDAVLGSQTSLSTDGLVLGGLEGVKLRLDSNDIKVKITALSDAIKYGNPGLELVVEALKKDKSESIQKATYLLLRKRTESHIKKIIQNYDYWNLFDYLYTLEGESHAVFCIAISPDGQTLFSGGGDRVNGDIKIWDLNTKKLQYRQVAQSHRISALAISIDGRSLASGSSCQIKIWDIEPEKIKNRINISIIKNNNGGSRGGEVTSLAFSANGQNIFSASPHFRFTNWGLDLDLEIAWGKDFEIGGADCFAISHNRQSIVTGTTFKVNLWDTSTGQLKKTLQSSRSALKTIVISADEKTIVGSGSYNNINIWDVETGNILHDFNAHDGQSGSITSLAISNDGKTIISGSNDKNIKIWDLNTTKLKKTLVGHLGYIKCVAISPDGQSIISASSNGEIKIWGLPEDISHC